MSHTSAQRHQIIQPSISIELVVATTPTRPAIDSQSDSGHSELIPPNGQSRLIQKIPKHNNKALEITTLGIQLVRPNVSTPPHSCTMNLPARPGVHTVKIKSAQT